MNKRIAAIVLLGVLLVGCGATSQKTATHANSGIWRIGNYTVRELKLPSSFFKNDNREFVIGTTLLTIGQSSPYTVTYKSLISKRSGHIVIGQCQSPPFWEQNDSLPWPEAALLCVQQGSNSTLYLIGNGGVSVSSFQFPARPSTASEYLLMALGFTGQHFQHLMWEIQQSEGPAPLVGSGILNLQTGQELPLPASLNAALYVSPNGTLYTLNGHTLSKWLGSGTKSLGSIPDLRVEAVGDDGAAWASVIPDPSDNSLSAPTELVREVPGSPKVRSWTVHGSVVGYGPGYIAWMPNGILSGPPLRVMFPLQGRTLTFNNVLGEPLVYGPSNGDVVSQIIFHTTSGGAAVIEISTTPRSP